MEDPHPTPDLPQTSDSHPNPTTLRHPHQPWTPLPKTSHPDLDPLPQDACHPNSGPPTYPKDPTLTLHCHVMVWCDHVMGAVRSAFTLTKRTCLLVPSAIPNSAKQRLGKLLTPMWPPKPSLCSFHRRKYLSALQKCPYNGKMCFASKPMSYPRSWSFLKQQTGIPRLTTELWVWATWPVSKPIHLLGAETMALMCWDFDLHPRNSG